MLVKDTDEEEVEETEDDLACETTLARLGGNVDVHPYAFAFAFPVRPACSSSLSPSPTSS